MADSDLIRRDAMMAQVRKWTHPKDEFYAAAKVEDAMKLTPITVEGRAHVITVTCDDDSTDRGPVWIATHLGSGITAEARTPADAVALCADRVPREAWMGGGA